MKQFIKVCDSLYGNRTCIYRYINVNQIVELHIEQTHNEVNVEATLTNGKRVIILDRKSLQDLVGDEIDKITEKINDIFNEMKASRQYGN